MRGRPEFRLFFLLGDFVRGLQRHVTVRDSKTTRAYVSEIEVIHRLQEALQRVEDERLRLSGLWVLAAQESRGTVHFVQVRTEHGCQWENLLASALVSQVRVQRRSRPTVLYSDHFAMLAVLISVPVKSRKRLPAASRST